MQVRFPAATLIFPKVGAGQGLQGGALETTRAQRRLQPCLWLHGTRLLPLPRQAAIQATSPFPGQGPLKAIVAGNIPDPTLAPHP